MENDIESMIVPVAINMLSMEPQSTIRATINPQVPDMDVEWTTTGNGFTIDPDGMSCRVTPDTGFQGDRASGTVVCTVSHQQLPELTASASCEVTVLKQPTAIQLSAVGAPGGYMVTVVQSAESYSRLWKLDAGDVYQGDVCDESGGWQSLPADGIIDAQSGVLTVVDVDASHEARRAGSVMLQTSANLACYGPVDGKATITSDGALEVTSLDAWHYLEWEVDAESYKGRTMLLSLDDADTRMRFGIVVDGSVGTNYVDAATRVRSVSIPGSATSVKFRVQNVNLDARGTLHPGVWVDAAERPAWTSGIIVGGGVFVESLNLWPVMQSTTVNGVTFTVDGQRVTINGTSTSYANINVAVTFDPGTYVLRDTGNPNVYLQVRYGDTVINTAEQPFTIDTQTAATVQLVCRSGASFDNMTVTPYLHALSGGGLLIP